MKKKIQTLLEQLNHGLVEREGNLKTALLTVLAGENLVLIGPPGTGKSMIARNIAKSFAYDRNDNKSHAYFEYLLTKFSTPEEIFGPLSIEALKKDCYKRNTAGYLPTVKIAFLDEIFKASSSILNSLLTILNERIYHNGADIEDVHMQALIAASNELPTDQEELSALYDRFLVRDFVDYIKPENLHRLFDKYENEPELSKLNADDLECIKKSARSVTIPQEVKDAVLTIWQKHKETFKEDRRESLSDRRLKKVIHLLCVSAATNGRSEVDLSDVLLLKNCLWNHQENAVKVLELIRNTLRTFSRRVPQSEDTAITSPAPALAQTTSKLGAVVKGFKGSGTAQDPLLIHTLDELMDLSRPDVGLQGYHFRQTANIDCTSLSSWTTITFKGHYDGGGYTIKYESKRKNPQIISQGVGMFSSMYTLFSPKEFSELFSSVQAQSSIFNLKLENLKLAKVVDGSRIAHCASNISLISDTARNSIITACESGASLISVNAFNCTISDCLVLINMDFDNSIGNYVPGGIVHALSEGSLVERCFVSGTLNSTGSNFNGIASGCDDSTIRRCALGRLDFGEDIGEVRELLTRISPGGLKSKLENNISINSNPGTDSINGKNGQTVDEKLFKQRYFEHTLDWDFNTVWQWDNKEDRPALRSVGVGSSYQQKESSGQDTNMTDLLTQQMLANIWL